MNVTMQLAVMVAVCLCLAEAAPVGRLTRSKQQRPTRGFKNVEMMTARGFGKRARTEHESRKTFKPRCMHLMTAKDFGKRSDNNDVNDEEEEIRVTRGTFKPNSNVLIARGYGKRQGENGEVYGMDNFWESLEGTQEKDGQETDEKPVESIPMDWFVNEMLNNPDFARSVVRKFVDQNQDGILSADELLRNTA
ncbi:allatotropin-like isoform X4 [Leptidea sinapis]|uniref:allatotropin-like isoform X4 n=1 Tax=Leptidea sinapis TaxID=189913 RepID=UPI0021C4A10C|nr:allatotropin-like isoform X4 [Leptidea sinapis]